MTQNDSEFVLYVNGKAWGLPGFTPQDIIPQAVCRFNGFAPQVRTGVDTEGSPTGQLPLLEFSQDTITPVGYPNILSLLRKHEKTIDVDSWLTQQQLIETDVFESFLDNELNLLLLYYFWYGKDNYQKAMTPLFGKFYGFPNGYLKAWIKHSQVVSVLSHLKLTNQQIVKEKVRKCFKLLSERLGTQSYFHGTKPSSLDAIVFGHIVIHLHSSVPNKLFQQILLKYPNLVQFCQNILKTYFADIILASPSLGNTPEFDATMIELSSEGIDEQEQEQLEEEEERNETTITNPSFFSSLSGSEIFWNNNNNKNKKVKKSQKNGLLLPKKIVFGTFIIVGLVLFYTNREEKIQSKNSSLF